MDEALPRRRSADRDYRGGPTIGFTGPSPTLCTSLANFNALTGPETLVGQTQHLGVFTGHDCQRVVQQQALARRMPLPDQPKPARQAGRRPTKLGRVLNHQREGVLAGALHRAPVVRARQGVKVHTIRVEEAISGLDVLADSSLARKLPEESLAILVSSRVARRLRRTSPSSTPSIWTWAHCEPEHPINPSMDKPSAPRKVEVRLSIHAARLARGQNVIRGVNHGDKMWGMTSLKAGPTKNEA